MIRRRLALGLLGLLLLALVAVGGRALGAEDPAAAGLPSWLLPTGGGLGATALSALVWAVVTGRVRVQVGPGEPDRRHDHGRRAEDDDAAQALARARLEGRREAEDERLRARVADLEAQVEEVAGLLATLGRQWAEHQGEHRAHTATLARIEAALAAPAARLATAPAPAVGG